MKEEILDLTQLYIILVEGSETQAHVIRNQFSELNIENLTVVANGEEALRAMDKDRPDLLISAMYLEDMTAANLIEKMRNDDYLDSVPFMLISSEKSFNALDPVRQAGIVGILEKPFDVKQLSDALNNALTFVNDGGWNIDDFGDIDMSYLKLLLVDDSPLARKHTRRILTSLGIEDIDEAVNGQDAIPYVEANFYDMIITDYNMPELDGLGLLQFVRSHETHSNIPMLMISSETDEAIMQAVRDSGINAICGKPYTNELFISYLRDILV